MRGLWRCSGCVGLLVLGMLTELGSANREDDGEYEVYWVEKSFNVLQHVKRKDVCATAGWSLCPASVGGGVSESRENETSIWLGNTPYKLILSPKIAILSLTLNVAVLP